MNESEYSLVEYENESRPVATNQSSGPEFERLCLLHEPQNLCPSCGGSARDEELNGGGQVYGLGDEWYCCDWTITITKCLAQWPNEAKGMKAAPEQAGEGE